MKKVFLVLLVCFMALGAKLAMADTRTDALGLTAGQQVDDLDSIWMFPQDAGNFGNVVDFRMGNPNGANFADWFGVIHKDFDEIGYIGVYTNRPFNQNDGLGSQAQWANQQGILNGNQSWSNMINPSNSNWQGSNSLTDNDGNVTATYAPVGGSNVLNTFTIFFNNVTVADPLNKADIFWAKDFADVTLGAHLNYASNQGNQAPSGTDGNTQGTPTLNGQASDTFTADSSVIGLDLGATLKNLGSNMSLALGLGYSMGSVNYKEVYSSNYLTVGTQTAFLNEAIKDNNISEIRVNALLKNKMNDTTTGRIYGNVRLDNLGFSNLSQFDFSGDGTYTDLQGETVKETSTYSDTNINLGLACDHSVADGKAKVIVGLEAILDSRQWGQTAYENAAGSSNTTLIGPGSGSTFNEDMFVVPFNVAIEAPINDWLTGRIGATKTLYSNITDKVTQLTNPNAAGTAFQDTTKASNYWDNYDNQFMTLTYGLSAKFNNLTIDLQINPNTLLNDAKSFEPGAGILYGSNGNQFNNGNTGLGDAFATISQADVRYAF